MIRTPDADADQRVERRLPGVFAAVGVAAMGSRSPSVPRTRGRRLIRTGRGLFLSLVCLLIGLVANDDGLFAAASHQLARTLRNGVVLFIGAAVTIGIVTALLNLDTSVAVTPRLKSRGCGPATSSCRGR